MDLVNQIQVLDEAVSISHSANILRKSMNSTVLHPYMGK